MAEDLNLQTKLTSTADTTGATEMSAGLTGVGRAADVVKTQVDALMQSFIALFAMSEVISFFKDVADAAYEEEKALRGVAQAALISGQDMNVAKEEANKFTSALSLQTGVIKTDLLDAYGKVYLATGKVTEAQKEVTLAANLAAVRHIEMATALRLVESAATGVPGRFDRIVGGVTEGTTAFEKHESMTKRLIKAYGDVSKVTDDAAAAVDRSARRWDQFKDTVGGPVLQVIATFKDGLAALPAMLGLMADIARVRFEEIAGHAGALARLLKNWDDPLVAWATYQGERVLIEQKADLAIRTAYADSKKWQRDRDAEATVAVIKDLDFRGAKEKAAIDTNLRNVMSEKEAEMRAADAAERYLDEATVKGVNARLKEAEREAAAKKKIAQDFLTEWRKINAEQDKIDKESNEASYKMQAKYAQAKLDMEVAVINGGLSLAGDAFGIKKELAIAQAVINTYEAAAQCIADYGLPYGAILAALAVAMGLEDVAQITSTSQPTMGGLSAQSIQGISGSAAGFDDPSNDQAAYQGGRKWAADMIQHFSGGATSAGWASGMGSGSGRSVTNNNSSVTNINISGGILDPNQREGMKMLARRLAIAQQSDGQRRIAGRT